MRRFVSACAVCLLVSSFWGVDEARGDIPGFDRIRVLSTPRSIADAELTDQNGEPFRLSELEGRVAFVFFGFTNCPDVCPLAMQRLQQLHQAGRLDLEDVAYVLISVDGERDTPAKMKEFLDEYSADFIGLTGDPKVVRPIAKDFAAPFYKGHSDHGGKYDVTHSPQIFILDEQGHLRAEAYNAPVESMAGIASALIDEES
jgi:protein SCO1/2